MNTAESIDMEEPALLDKGQAAVDPDIMELDAQTFRDLEVFESAVPGATLFELCNHTRSNNGAKALRERMKRPWATAERIRATQQSLIFITANRELFDRLPSYVSIQLVNRYFDGTLPPLMSRNVLDFGLGVLDLLYTDIRRYDMITQGVAITSSMIHELRQIAHAEELLAMPSCELGDILSEMRELLSLPGLAFIDDSKSRVFSAWTILRSDQVFRYYEREAVTRLLQLSFEIDALLSLADTTRKLGFVMPVIEEGPLLVQAEAVVHPLVHNAVANSVSLNQEQRLLFLTGPNMAGKTTYLRSYAVAVYFAHLGMGVAARSFRFVPAQKLFSSITLADNLHAGVSFFRAEGLRVKAIAQAVADGYRVIALMDEPFKGTNVKDALDASRAILIRLAAKEGSLFMFSSHLIELSEELGAIAQVDCRYFEAQENEGRLSFEYVLHAGVSSQRLGMRVLQEEGIFELLDGKT